MWCWTKIDCSCKRHGLFCLYWSSSLSSEPFLARNARLSGDGPLIQPCSRSSPLLPNLVYRRRHHPPPFPLPLHPSSVSSGSSRLIFAMMRGCLGQVDSGYPGQARWVPCPRRYRKWRKCSKERKRGLLEATLAGICTLG